jgi:hypothetical protein
MRGEIITASTVTYVGRPVNLRVCGSSARGIKQLDNPKLELQSMRAVLADLASHCHGDHRPECPILDDLGRLPPSE